MLVQLELVKAVVLVEADIVMMAEMVMVAVDVADQYLGMSKLAHQTVEELEREHACNSKKE